MSTLEIILVSVAVLAALAAVRAFRQTQDILEAVALQKPVHGQPSATVAGRSDTDTADVVAAETRAARADGARSAAEDRGGRRRALPVLARTCDSCVHFDLALGQREREMHMPFDQASKALPPWRMGRALKTDENGAHLPLEQQDISDETLGLAWHDLGACRKHKQLVFGAAVMKSCADHQTREDA